MSDITTPAGHSWVVDTDHWHQRRVAVTGATGLLGQHLTARLVALGADVVVLLRDDVPMLAEVDWNDSVTVVRGAVEDQELLERLFGEYEIATVLHLAAQTQVGVANRNPVSTWSTNIAGTWALLEAARHSPRIEAIVTASSDKAYGDQPELPYDEAMPLLGRHPYDASKVCADVIAQSYATTFGSPVLITRCGNFYGPGDHNWQRIVPGTIRSVLEDQPPLIRSDGSLVRDYLFVDDGVSAYLCSAEAMAQRKELAGRAFNFSDEHPLSVLELVEVIQQAAGTSLEPVVMNEADNEIQAQYLSSQRAREELGWTTAVGLTDGMKQTVDWYRQFLGL